MSLKTSIATAALVLAAAPALAAEGERVQITGEIIDTWCCSISATG